MHDSLSRVIWKEYRAQRQVWLALAIGVLLLQLIPASLAMFSPYNSRGGYADGMLTICIVVAICYSVTSSAILFAGELEEETATFVRYLPIAPKMLIGGKLIYTVTSLLALMAAGTVTAVLLSGFVGLNWPSWSAENLNYLARSLAGGLAWGVFFSLLMDRVLTALACAMAAEFLTAAFAGNAVPRSMDDVVYWLIVVGVMAIDGWLALLWAQCRAMPGQEVSQAQAGKTADRETFWLKTLMKVAQSGSPAMRSTGALAWRELRAVAPFAAIWALLGIVLVDLMVRWEAKMAFNVLFFFLTPIVCGLMTCVGDKRRETFRFLTDRGVAPVQAWAVKIGVWAAVMVLFLCLFGWYDGTFTRRFGSAGTSGEPLAIGQILMRIAAPPWDNTSTPAQALWLTLHLAISLAAMMFVVGQWCSFWHRRSIVSGAAGLGLGFLSAVWHMIAISADVPLLLATWPVTVAGVLATGAMSGSWLLDDRRWSTFAKRAIWVALPCLIVGVGYRSWRISSVPIVGSPADLSKYPLEMYSTTVGIPLVTFPALGGDDAPQKSVEPREVEFLPATILPLLLNSHAAALAKEGKLNEAWKDYETGLDALRTQSSAVADWWNWYRVLEGRAGVLDGVREWAANPKQTVEGLDAAIQWLENEVQRPLTPIDMIGNRYGVWRDVYSGKRSVEPMISRLPEPRWIRGLMELFGETRRAMRMMDLITAKDYVLAMNWPLDSADRSAADLALMIADDGIGPAANNTLLLPNEFQASPGMSPSSAQLAFQKAKMHDAAMRGTLLCLLLQRYRLVHGEFPVQLQDAYPALSREPKVTAINSDAEAAKSDSLRLPDDVVKMEHWLRDPFSQEVFHYSASGLTAPVDFQTGEDIPAKQPLLWSVGPNEMRIEPARNGQPGLTVTPRSIHVYSRESITGDRFTDVRPDRVRFAILQY
jgi:hypothetical protein